MSRTKLIRNLVPAVIVALVLGTSFVISGYAKDKGGEGVGNGHQCGYGYTQADKDENGTEHGNNNDTKAHGEDNDRCEDEGEAEGGGDHGDGHIDETQRAGEREGERGRSG